MGYTQALLRLKNHGSGGNLPIEESFLGSLYLAEKARTPPEIDGHAADVLACLQTVNTEINGARPSETIKGKAESLPRDLVYAIAEILTGSIKYQREWSQAKTFDAETLQRLERATHMIAFAWMQVLAGDIDDLAEEWRGDQWASGEPGAPPNGGPATPVGNSGATEGPPSVS